MKLSQDEWAMLFFTVAAGIILWIGKIVIGWISKAIMAAVLKEMTERIEEVEEKVEANKTANANTQKYADENRERINFLIDSLINKNK